MASGIQGAPGVGNAQAFADAQAKRKADAEAKKAKIAKDKAAKKQLEANAGGAYAAAMDATTAGLYAAGTPLALTGRLLYQGREVTANELLNKFYSWGPAEINAFDSKIKSLQIRPSNKLIDPDDRRDIYVTAVARASQFYALTKGENKVDGSLEGTLLAYKGLAADSGGEPNLPSRNINKLSDAAINAIIDQVSQAQLRKKINDPNGRAVLFDKIKKQIERGTLTTTKKVKNPKTGKLESVTTTTGMDIQDIQLQLGEDLKSSYAEDYKLNKLLGFGDALTRVTSRGV